MKSEMFEDLEDLVTRHKGNRHEIIAECCVQFIYRMGLCLTSNVKNTEGDLFDEATKQFDSICDGMKEQFRRKLSIYLEKLKENESGEGQ